MQQRQPYADWRKKLIMVAGEETMPLIFAVIMANMVKKDLSITFEVVKTKSVTFENGKDEH
jgi:hypothetical protein